MNWHYRPIFKVNPLTHISSDECYYYISLTRLIPRGQNPIIGVHLTWAVASKLTL